MSSFVGEDLIAAIGLRGKEGPYQLPSFVEMIILDRLDVTIHKSIEHVQLWATQHMSDTSNRNPLEVKESIETMFQAFTAIFQIQFLKHRDATVLEALYGLKRVSYDRTTGIYGPLQLWQKYVTAASLLVVPKIVSLLKLASDRFLARRRSQQQGRSGAISSVLRYWHTTIRQTIPVLEAAWGVSKAAFQLLYLLDRCKHYHPLLALMGVVVVKNDEPGVNSKAPEISNEDKRWSAAIIITAAVAVKVFQWCAQHRIDSANNSAIVRSQWPEYPAAPPVGKGCVVVPQDKQLCPLCRKLRSNPCTSRGGYVFCYSCLLDHLQISKTCPVSGIPCMEDDIIRLYESS